MSESPKAKHFQHSKPNLSSNNYTDLRKTFSSTSAASSATGITSADLVSTFRDRNSSDPIHSQPHPSTNMSGLTQDSSVDPNDPNHAQSPPDQYYYSTNSADTFSQATTAADTNNDNHRSMNQDASKAVQDMHHALLYLMSQPEEFQRAIAQQNLPHTAHIDLPQTLHDWNHQLHSDIMSEPPPRVPLPYLVFTPDAEVVLPQAHTASQLFGTETITGVELEAAAGIPALSQLFLRWLALLPQGDHLNIIDPPGLTMMRIAGGRFRVTAAHRVVWTWYNEFLPEALSEEEHSDTKEVMFGDLVSMTIMDVFETDQYGRLLSYCPTFDNRGVHKTSPNLERLSKQSYKIRQNVDRVKKSTAAKGVNKAASFLGRMSYSAGKKTFDYLKKEVERQSHSSTSPSSMKKNSSSIPKIPKSPSSSTSYASSYNAHNKSSQSQTPPGINASSTMRDAMAQSPSRNKRSEHYISDDDDDDDDDDDETTDVSER